MLYRHEDGHATDLSPRNQMGDKWCRENYYGGKYGSYADCGNWAFKFVCKFLSSMEEKTQVR